MQVRQIPQRPIVVTVCDIEMMGRVLATDDKREYLVYVPPLKPEVLHSVEDELFRLLDSKTFDLMPNTHKERILALQMRLRSGVTIYPFNAESTGSDLGEIRDLFAADPKLSDSFDLNADRRCSLTWAVFSHNKRNFLKVMRQLTAKYPVVRAYYYTHNY